MEPRITNNLIEAAIRCPHKVTHILGNSPVDEGELHRVLEIVRNKHRERCLRSLKKTGRLAEGVRIENLHEAAHGSGPIYAINFPATTDIVNIVFDAVRIEKPTRTAVTIEPIFFSLKRTLDADERRLTTVRSLLLQEMPRIILKAARVFLLGATEPLSIRISARDSDLRFIQDVKSINLVGKRETYARVIPHCKECPFEQICREELKARDDLSLLGGLSKNEIKANQAKGIFTINQLSHTYRPRRRPDDSKPKFYASLKAMSIRENKVYLTQPPTVPSEKVDVFLDVEGLPETDIYYLIGVHVRTPRRTTTHYLWANGILEERKIWIELLALLKGFKHYTIFHYGNYERTFFDRMKKRYRLPAEESKIFDLARSRLVNVVSLIYGRIYFPTYSNGLKDIGRFLGAEWSKGASGILSTAWRAAWELSSDADFQDQIVKYNADDCFALGRVVDFVRRLSSSKGQPTIVDGKPIGSSDDIRWRSTYNWGRNSFLISEFDQINKCAYFDYQSTKIFFGKRPKKKRPRRSILNGKRYFKANKTIVIEPSERCPRCDGTTYRHTSYTKTLKDLKFSDGGVKRWIVKFQGRRRRCRKCKHAYLSPKYVGYKPGYGHNLAAFVGYLNIALRMSFGEIREYFRRVFGMDIPTTTLSKMKQALATYYEPTVKALLQQIKTGQLLQVDETNAKADGKGCYVWIFATLSEVVYLFADSRKGDILHKNLKHFDGVLISDFFAAYDSVPCEQQKCLIHLMRDLNDDLFKNQLNQEFKGLVHEFAILMKGIVNTIDKWGLRARYLSKHKSEVRRYFRRIGRSEYQTEIAQQYRKRFLKNEHRLFTFLKYNNVPWNNNYAENAIKTFAEFRRKFNPHFQRNGLKEYLVLLSIQHTCKLRRIDFLQFLLSRKKCLPGPDWV